MLSTLTIRTDRQRNKRSARSLNFLALFSIVVVSPIFIGSTSVDEDPAAAPTTTKIDFNRQIRPIISNNCFRCHGPDISSREANLRLDSFADATLLRADSSAGIVPGNPDASLIIQRITHTDDSERMPPIELGKTLTTEDIALLTQWINEGAEYQTHWAFVPPSLNESTGSTSAWVKTPIDHFILNKLTEHNLRPSSPATKSKLLRRVTLDLTGLPPSLGELDAFLADESPDAFSKVVDRLFASPHYGEHMAKYWLDAARYGDTHGLHLDNYRAMWRWRDWVINAFNDNQPFDQFTIEQLAGDLLPDPSMAQLIASGFNRNNVTTSEGGAIPEEFLVHYAVDRVETTSTVWMGLTVQCAACHDHKFDPITQKEFYQLFAFFNNITENGMDGNRKDPPPTIKAPSPDQQIAIDEIESRRVDLTAKINAPDPIVDAAQLEWESENAPPVAAWWHPLAPIHATSTGGSTLQINPDNSVLATGANPPRDDYIIVATTDLENIQLVQLEALLDDSLPHRGPGRAENANFVLNEFELVAVSIADPTVSQPIKFKTAFADFEQIKGEFLVAKTLDAINDGDSGWAVAGYDKREPRTAVYLAETPFGFTGGTELRFILKHQSPYTQHGIGRLRFAISNDADLSAQLQNATTTPWFVAGPFHSEEKSTAAIQAATFAPESAPDQIDLTTNYLNDTIKWIETADYVDGKVHTLPPADFASTYLYRSIESPSYRKVSLSLGSDDGFTLWVNGKHSAESSAPRGVAPDQNIIPLELRPGINHILLKITNYAGGYGFYFKLQEGNAAFLEAHTLKPLALEAAARTPAQNTTLRDYFRKQHSPEIKKLYDELDAVAAEEQTLFATIPTTMVMQENPERRQAYLLERGQYDRPKEEVQPNVPAVLPTLTTAGDQASRLDLANWLVDPGHPLTARVIVNRLWQQLFGQGLVSTSADFGSQGTPPTHPELLDYLALELINSGWDLQHILRLMVHSAVYQQTTRTTPHHLELDPNNLYYSRAPRFRMEAEMIRDFALATSGLLNRQLGGPSVRPYQPSGLWQAVAYPDSDTNVYQTDAEFADTHRRSIYTFWKRTLPPPNLVTFDAPSRETCIVQRARTNTPLQMLVLMNDPQFIEASIALGNRALLEAAPTPDAQITYAFRLATARYPDTDELTTLREIYDRQIKAFTNNPTALNEFLAPAPAPMTPDDPAQPTPPDEDQVQRAALATVANIILSLDESITKG